MGALKNENGINRIHSQFERLCFRLGMAISSDSTLPLVPTDEHYIIITQAIQGSFEMVKTFSKLALSAAVAGLALGASAQQLEEVVVTAQKRTESLQDVPISVTAISGDQIAMNSIRSFSELGAYVPNFSVSENPVNTIITMRGISVGGNQAFEQSVGLFLDGVYLGRSRQARLGLFDLEQVEVLRGPQGILFGKNTLAGAINVRSASPEVGGDLTGRLAASFESDNGEYFEGHIGGSVSENVAVRFSMMDRSIDGYLDNAAPNAGYPDQPTTDETIARIGLQWEPSESTSVGLRYTYADYERVGSNVVVTKFSPTMVDADGDGTRETPFAPATDFAVFGLVGVAFPGFNSYATRDSRTSYYDGYSFGGTGGLDGGVGPERLSGTDTQNHEFSLNIEHEFGNGMTLTAVTGFSEYEYKDGIEADFLPLSFIGRSDDSEFDQFSQEIRLASSVEGGFSWVVGGTFVESTQEIDRFIGLDGTLGIPQILTATSGVPTILAYTQDDLDQIGAAFGIPAGGLPAGVEGLTMWSAVGRGSEWVTDTESWAIFAQATWDITDRLSLTAGVRYTEETKDASAEVWLNDSTQGFGTKPAYPEESLVTAQPDIGNLLQQELQGALFGSYGHHFVETRKTDQTIPAITLNWRPADNHLLYTSYTEGFKSGGFNAVDSQEPVLNRACPLQNLPGCIDRDAPGAGFEFDDESAWSFEVGGKHTLLDGRLRLNWAYFNSEYDDQQVSTFEGLGFVVTNASSTEISGFEVDAAFQATSKLRFNLSVGTVDGKYGSFPGAGCTAEQTSDIEFLDFVTPGGLTPNSPRTTSVDGNCAMGFDAQGFQTGVSQDLSGRDLGTAKYSGSFGAQYAQPIGSMIWFTQVDVNFFDDYIYTGDLDVIDTQEGAELINFRTGLMGENWTLMLYGRNITDESIANGGADVTLSRGSHMRYLGRGEVFGIQAVWEF